MKDEKYWDWELIWHMSEIDCGDDALSKWNKILAKALLEINERLKKLEKHYNLE